MAVGQVASVACCGAFCDYLIRYNSFKMKTHIFMPIVLFLGVLCVYASPLPDKADLLAENTVIARYEGTVDHPCMFRTAQCPDHCDHATRLAHFRVLENKRYVNCSEYGDGRLNPGDTAVVDVLKDIPGQEKIIAQSIASLSPGDCVLLTIAHYYVQQEQCNFPVRPAIEIRVLNKRQNADQTQQPERERQEREGK